MRLEKHFEMVRAIAGKIKKRVPQHVELDDLVQAGMVGLIEADQRYKPELGEFAAFASSRVRGAILDELRSMDPLARADRKAIRRFRAEGEELTETQKRVMVAANHQPLEERDDNGLTVADKVASHERGPLEETIEAERARYLRRQLLKLRKREREVVKLLFFDHVPLRVIGESMGIGESRVSQINKSAIQKLRTMVTT